MVKYTFPTTQQVMLQPSVTTVGDPTHTKEEDPSILPTMVSVINAELLDTTLINAKAVHLHRIWKTPPRTWLQQ